MYKGTKKCLAVMLFILVANAISFAQNKALNAKEPAEETATPPVHFNHIYIVIDDTTYEEIKNSEFQGPGIEIKVQTETDPIYRISSLTVTLENQLKGPIGLHFGSNARLKIASDRLGKWQFGKH